MSDEMTLFPLESIPQFTDAELYEQKWGRSAEILRSLGMEYPTIPSDFSPYIRVTPKLGALVLQPQNGFGTADSSSYYGGVAHGLGDQMMHWNKTTPSQTSYDGFLECMSSLNNSAMTPILHLVEHCTDLDATSTAFPVDSIQSIHTFGENVSEVMSYYQNAEMDGTTGWLQRHRGLDSEPNLTAKELLPYIALIPEPKLAYLSKD